MKISETKYLGKLCLRGHDYNSTGKSLRKKHNGACKVCDLIGRKIHRKKYQKEIQEYNKIYKRDKDYTINGRDWYKKNKERILFKLKTKRKEDEGWHKKKLKASRKCNLLASKELTDGYVIHILFKKRKLNRSQIPQELVEAKRLHLQIYRFIKNGGIKNG